MFYYKHQIEKLTVVQKLYKDAQKPLFFANSEIVTHCYHCIKHVLRVVILFKNVVFLINKCLRTLSICGSYPVSGNYFSFEQYSVHNYLVLSSYKTISGTSLTKRP